MLDSTTDLKSMLTRPDLLCSDAFLAGKWVQAKDGKTFDVTNPARGDVIAKVADLSRTEIALAIDAAEKGDNTIVEELYQLLLKPYDAQPEMEKWFVKRPQWAMNKVGCSMLSCSS